MMEVTEYISRTATADLDCIAICPLYPDYLIYGTYSIIKRTSEQEYSAQIRAGSIQVLPVSSIFEPSYPGMLPPKLAHYTFPAAVLDIQFHPSDGNLLGAALSNGTVYFFRVIKRGDILERCVITELFPLGYVVVRDVDEDGVIPLVTQLTFLSSIKEVGRRDVSNTLTITFAATLSSHDVKVIKTKIPGIRSTYDHRLAYAPKKLDAVIEDIHTHTLEAWTVALLPLPNTADNYLLLSGGDDSALLASLISADHTSRIDTSLLADPPTQIWSDTKTHSAGVTAIFPLPPPTHGDQSALPFLTGSYDESLRLFTLSPPTYRRTLHTSLPLRGGVWRLNLMDTYSTLLPPAHPGLSSEKKRCQTHHLILVSCMHAGVKLVRVTHSERSGWELSLQASFTRGHGTLVYAADFNREWRGDVVVAGATHAGSGGDVGSGKQGPAGRAKSEVGRYTIVSTSFYDRQICNWAWRDGRRKEATV